MCCIGENIIPKEGMEGKVSLRVSRMRGKRREQQKLFLGEREE